MSKENEIEILAQILATKRHSSIEWGRECAKIVIESGYTRTHGEEIMTVEEIAKIIRTTIFDSSTVSPAPPNESCWKAAQAICATFGTPSKPEPTITQKLLKAQEMHGGVASEDKLVEENTELKQTCDFLIELVNDICKKCGQALASQPEEGKVTKKMIDDCYSDWGGKA